MGTRLKLDRAKLDALVESRGFNDHAKKIAGEIAKAARPFASGDASANRRYGVRLMAPGRVRVGTNWPYAHIDEWGSVHRAPLAPLRRAVDRVGVRLEETR